MTLDFSRCRLTPFKHQLEDVKWLIERPYAFIASDMRTGKTKIVIDAAQFMFTMNMIKRVVVIAPAPVRDVWADRTLGELAKHLWTDLPSTVTEYHARTRTWLHAAEINEPRLDWYVTNYEFIRTKNRLDELLPICNRDTLLVLDESSFVKNHVAAQTKACVALRWRCGRVVLLNGTPIFHSPLDLFSQGNLLHPSILNCPYITKYKARYAIQEAVLTHGGKPLVKEIVGRGGRTMKIPIQTISSWTNLDDLQRRFAPVTVRRLQKECLDLPPKLDPVTMTAVLTPETWRAYKDMRDELVVWLSESDVATSATAAIRALRLSQITSGFVGGVEDAGIEPVDEQLINDIMIPGVTHDIDGDQPIANDLQEMVSVLESNRTQEIGREKLNILLWFIEQQLESDLNLKLVSWFRFRPEIFRAVAAVSEKFPQFTVGTICGGQKRKERLEALALLKPETAPEGPVFVAGIEGTGSFGIDMCAAHTCVSVSSGYSPGRTAQTLDRVYGPGQKHPIAYFEVVAVGPHGQRTIDHQIIAARRAGEDIAKWTAEAWVKKLLEE